MQLEDNNPRKLIFSVSKQHPIGISDLIKSSNSIDGVNSTRIQNATDEVWIIVIALNVRATTKDIFNIGVTIGRIIASNCLKC